MANVATQQPNGILFSEPTMFRNRIINGDMRIDQRYAGAATPNWTAAASNYVTDRFAIGLFGSTYSGNVMVAQQVTDAPAGFTNSLKVTASQNVSFDVNKLGAFISHSLEGFNVADFDFGLSTVKTITISFWVKSNKTGTVSVALENAAANRGYGATVTISQASTWEYKTITVSGDSTGTWVKNNGAGLILSIGIANNGSWLTAASGTWSSTRAIFNASQTNFLSTTSDYLAITGVQVEKGITATPFEFRPYGTELALCQRYFEKSFDIGTAPAANTGDFRQGVFCAEDASIANMSGRILFKVSKRPGTITTASYNPIDATNPTTWRLFTGSWQYLTPSLTASENGIQVTLSGASGLSPNVSYYVSGHWTASSEL